LRNPSDLSLASDGILGLPEALVESDIPILMQIVDWARIPVSFHAEIEVGYVVVLE
jgi:hypothetical protein